MPTNLFGISHVPRSFSLVERIEYYSIPEPTSGCFLWLGGLTDGRYAAITWKDEKKQVSRLLWEEINGPIPDGFLVCHKCDNTICVCLDHFFLGTSQDNNDDMRRKGREKYLTGEKHYACRISDANILVIRASDEHRKFLAERYDVSPDTITAIRGGHKRRSVGHGA